ncbi:MAG: carbohydrate binding domain-containing protein [Planctomycetes bacterium]|nr:carbohydrate binding domain-containing protein [Planctomycetota bacterium]
MCGKYLAVFLCLVVFGASAAAGEFVPFVIPARQNERSVIAMESVPIRGEQDRVTVKDGHFSAAGERIRFWGVNLSFGANLPGHKDAEEIARRLAAAGINSVRCHHMDSARWPRGWWNAADGKTIEPEAFDRLDYFIDQLAKNGVYVDLNLHVGREHSRYIGLPTANRKYDKISNIFTPAIIEAQKGFARQVLGHVNKYRNVTYARDPAIAIVEITNENSFFMWSAEETLRTLPDYYAKILQGQYNSWLGKEYGSTRKLSAVWGREARPLGESVLRNGDFGVFAAEQKVPNSWILEQHSGSQAQSAPTKYKGVDCVELKPTAVRGTDWHLQFNQSLIKLEEGKYYTVTFRAAGEKKRSINCNVSEAHEPWGNMGLSRKVELTDGWRIYRFGFVAKSDDDNARLTFVFGGDEAKVYLADVKFQPGGLEGLGRTESVEKGTVRLYADSETTQRVIDRMRFLADTEKAYFDDMRNYIQKEMSSRSLVTGTIVFGPLGMYAQSDMDFIDAHAYWQHPRFPNRPWDAGDWLIEQKAMTDHPDEATLFRLAAERLADKPFTVTEYNHPAPLDSQAECVPMLASFAAAQDWDGVWLYTYSHSGDQWDRRVLSSYFDIDTNPAKWGFVRAAAAIFGEGQIGPLGGKRIVGIGQGSDVIAGLAARHLRHGGDMFGIIAQEARLSRANLLSTQVAVQVGGMEGRSQFDSRSRVDWTVDDNGKGLYFAAGRGGWVLTGHAERIKAATEGLVEIETPEFVAVTVSALDGADLYNSRKVLVAACGRCENVGMKFSADRRTVGRQWGVAPVRIETAKGRFRLTVGRWKCQALSPDGVPTGDVPVLRDNDGEIFEISGKYKTMWYLLRRIDK